MPTPQISTFDQLKEFIDQYLPDNISAAIDPVDIRTSILSLIEIQSLKNDLITDASVEGDLIAFSPNIYFDKPTSFSSKNVNAAITFVPIGSGAKINYGTCVRLIADGVNIPDFSRFKKLSGSQPYDNTAGVLNVCFFYFDGIDAWLNLWQGVGTSNIDTSDVIPPTAPTIVLGEITSTTVQLSWSGATDDVAVTSYDVYKNGVLFDIVSASPLIVTGLSASTAYTFKVKSKDGAGNSSGFSNTISATTVDPIPEDLIFNSLGDNATFNNTTKVLTGSSASSGGIITPMVPTLDQFELILGASSDVAVLYLATGNSGSYVWTSVTDMIFGIFRSAGTIQMVKGSARSLAHSHTGTENFARIKRVGNNAVMAVSNDGNTWTAVYTESNGFSGLDTAYIKGLFVSAGNLNGKKFK